MSMRSLAGRALTVLSLLLALCLTARCARKNKTADSAAAADETVLALITITDADEQSRIGADDLLAFLASKGRTQVLGYGAFAPVDVCPPDGELPLPWKGSRYQQFIDRVKGKWFPLCTPDFGEQLALIADDLVDHAYSASLPLQGDPDLKTLTVTYEGRALSPSLYRYDSASNSLSFADFSFAASGGKIIVSYDGK
jgi:hypothetical protein